MKQIFTLLSFLLLTGLLFNSCKNPTDDIDVLFDASVIKYKAAIMVTDAATGGTPAGLTVQVTGADAANIYDFSGTKALYSPGGIITLGVNYKFEPTATKSVKFNVLLKATGYEDANIPVTILNGQLSQIVKVSLLKTNVNTTASTFATSTTTLTANATTAPVTLTTTANGNVPTTTTITIPTGTQFKDVNNTLLTGTAVAATVINFDASDPASVSLFPGGDLSPENVVMAGGTTAGPAFFLPAGFANVKMLVGGTEVKNFSGSISVAIQLDPNYKLADGTAIAAGMVLPVYSYDVASGQFKSEGTGTVTMTGTTPSLTFSTTHLTIFVVGQVMPGSTCKPVNVNIAASWMNDGTRPVRILVTTALDKLIASKEIVVSNGAQGTLIGLPSFAMKYSVFDIATGETLARGNLNNACDGPTLNVTLDPPSTPVENITLTLNVKCPSKGTILIPNFDMYYKLSTGTSYSLLGTANGGLIKTTLLKKGVAYDFKAIWGKDEKIVKNRVITEQDMSTTVGDGALSSENSALLIQACK